MANDDTTTSQGNEQKPAEPAEPAEPTNSGVNLPDPNPQKLDEAQKPGDLEKRRK